MRVSLEKDTLNGEDLVSVHFERVAPGSRSVAIEVVFGVHYPVGLGTTSVVLLPKSATRIDTRQPVDLTDEESLRVFQAAAEHVAE